MEVGEHYLHYSAFERRDNKAPRGQQSQLAETTTTAERQIESQPWRRQ